MQAALHGKHALARQRAGDKETGMSESGCLSHVGYILEGHGNGVLDALGKRPEARAEDYPD
jgi:hypothetical protein